MDFARALKFNPNHDELGRFSTGSSTGGAGGSTERSLSSIIGAISHDTFWNVDHNATLGTRTDARSTQFEERLLGVRDNDVFTEQSDIDDRISDVEKLVDILDNDKNYVTADKATLLAELRAVGERLKAMRASGTFNRRTPAHPSEPKYYFRYTDNPSDPDWYQVNANAPPGDPRRNPGYDSGQG